MDCAIPGLLRDFGVAALGTLVGAWAAFKLERRHQKDAENSGRLSRGRQAQFTLLLQ